MKQKVKIFRNTKLQRINQKRAKLRIELRKLDKLANENSGFPVPV